MDLLKQFMISKFLSEVNMALTYYKDTMFMNVLQPNTYH